MPFLLRVELIDDERGNRVDGFEIRFDSQQMAHGLLTLVKKNAGYAGREVADLGTPVDASKVRSRLIERLGKRPESQSPGISQAPAGPPRAPPGASQGDAPSGSASRSARPEEGRTSGEAGRPSGASRGDAPAPKRSLLWLKK